MKPVKTLAILSLVAIVSLTSAQAWGKREQGILIGAGAAVLLPHLLHSPTYRSEPMRHYGYGYGYQRYYAPAYVYAPPPRQTYIIQERVLPAGFSHSAPAGGFTHRRPKPHTFINNRAGDNIVIEHSDGSKTIIVNP